MCRILFLSLNEIVVSSVTELLNAGQSELCAIGKFRMVRGDEASLNQSSTAPKLCQASAIRLSHVPLRGASGT